MSAPPLGDRPIGSSVAFPATAAQVENGLAGMTLRDWFAGQALIGLMCNPRMNLQMAPMAGETVEGACAEFVYGYADAMLKERAK